MSELLVYNAALGGGYEAKEGMDDVAGWVLTAAVHPETHNRLAQASYEFLSEEEIKKQELKVQVKELEASSRRSKSALALLPDVLTLKTCSIEDLKSKAAQVVIPVWKDYHASRSALLDLLSRSKYRAVAFIDADGSRSGLYTRGRSNFLHDMSCVSMTNSYSTDATLLRSSSTNEANVYRLSGSKVAPKFSWVSCADVRGVNSVRAMIRKKDYAYAARNISLTLPVAHSNTPETNVSPSMLLKALRDIYTRGEEGKTKIQVGWSSQTNSLKWHEMLSTHPVILVDEDLSDKEAEAVADMTVSVPLLVKLATRAVITKRLLSHEGGEELELTSEDLNLIKLMVSECIKETSALRWLRAKSLQAATAREGRVAKPETIMKVQDELSRLILASDTGLVTRRQALSIPGATLGLLESIAQGELFVEVEGKNNIRIGTASSAYRFREATIMDPEECEAEFEKSEQEDSEDGSPDLTTSSVVLLAQHLERQAQENNSNPEFSLPVVQVDTLNRAQIRDLPAALRRLRMKVDVELRGGGRREPDPENLYEEQELEELPRLRRGVTSIWFRNDPKGKPYRNWGLSKLRFPQWAERKEEA